MEQNQPLFITLEGGEGTGKSTLCRSLADFLISKGHDVVVTREPGGTIGAEQIRNLLVKGDVARWNVMSEICLFYAAREDHLHNLIRPALAQNKIVICDRFIDSTRAYQGALGAKEKNVTKALEENIVGSDMPDITLILDLSPEIGLRRAKSRNDDEGRFEAKTIEFHQNLRNAFLQIAKNDEARCKIIDASQTIENVFAQSKKIIENALGHYNGTN